jgi:methyl-accepting chemotaxis protein
MDSQHRLTTRVVLGAFVSTIACISVYCIFLPFSLAFDSKERIEFWLRMLTVGLLADALASYTVYRLSLPIGRVLAELRRGGGADPLLFKKALSALEYIPNFLLWFGAFAYFGAASANIGLDLARGKSPDLGLIAARFALAIGWGFLNGIVTARVINIILIEAKQALGIYDLSEIEQARKGKLMSLQSRLAISGFALFLFLLAFSGVVFYVRLRRFSELSLSGADAAALLSAFSSSVEGGIAILAGLLVIATGLYFVILAEMQAHLNDLSGQVSRMARGDRDLSARVNVVSFDDIGRMTSGFNRILDGLADTFRTVKTMTNGVYSRSHLIRKTSSEARTTATSLARLAEETDVSERERMAELDTAMAAFRRAAEGIGSSSGRSADEARRIEEAAGRLRSIIETLASSGDQAQRTESAFGALSAAAEAGTAGIARSLEAATEIEEAGNRVSGIARIIADVADRSNLLAMNASIEAAHAGAAGKGFGVVSREMKTLAESVAKAAREIDSEVKAVQETNQRTIAAVQGLGGVFKGLSSEIHATGAALSEISNSARRNASEAQGDLELMGRLRSFVGEILGASAAANASVAELETAVHRLSGSQSKSREVNAALTEGVRSIVGAFDHLDSSLGGALDEVAALEKKVASYKLE